MTYNYILTIDYPEKVVEIKTNDIFEVMRELDKLMATDLVTLVNGLTGEVLLRNSSEEFYFVKELNLMFLGWVMTGGEEV